MSTYDLSNTAVFLLHHDGRRRFKYPNNFLDFVFADGSVPVHIVQGKRPLQLLQSLSPRGEVQGDDVFLKVQSSICIGVKTPEHVSCVLCGVCVWEEAGVDAFKLLFADLPAGTLLQEGLVPGAQLGLGVFCVGFQIFQELL